ncbi:hypothetical protein SAMN05421636_103469 [Pricia antarctica]|uniref:Uncharacterized protein n=1 Tax=Pricia antarctica TaxID=641691 RepID=A0A1G7ANG2_9FLAO|nr:hypothetical protein [Pricia antarctica]SDE16464.1 hypothetical protein SAMN05421636_103469 [Pricia antarctica]
MTTKGVYGLVFIGLCVLIIGAATMSPMQTNEGERVVQNDSVPNRRQLRRSFFENRAILVVYGATDKILAEKYRALLEELSHSPESDSWRNASVSFTEASEIDEKEVKEKILYLVGTAAGNPLLKDLTLTIPVKFHKQAFTFNTKEYGARDMNLSVGFYPNPQNDTLPISFLSGNDERKVFQTPLFERIQFCP